MAQIDSLEIQITADAQKAVTSLKNLSQSLQNISTALSRVNGSGFSGISSGINSLTKAMQGYASSGVKTADFTRLATQLDKVASVNSAGLYNMAGAINHLVNSTNGVSTLGAKTSNIAEFSKTLSKLGGVNIGKAVTNIPQLAKAMKELLTTLSQSPNVSKNVVKLTRSLADLTKNMSGIKVASNGSAKGLMNFTSSAQKTTSASKGLASAIGKVYATYWLLFRAFGVFRKAVDYASSLTEIQNVVEQTFGQSTKKINEFAQASKTTLGMSELTYKQIASRYQAMGGAMDISNSALKKTNDFLTTVTKGYNDASKGATSMSVSLTKLAGDMASFYDTDQKDVAQDLEAVYTGMTRPLRKYGLDLTQTTLQEYANKRGIDAKVSSMTQAEKTMLRYQYVLEHTTKAQGDFERTANTWANQVKVMKQNFISLGTTIGQVFINAFKPWIQTMNRVLVAVNNFAIKVANALGNIFGWTYEGNDVGLLSDFEDDASELADDFGSANKEAKKLKATIMGYDELNVMQKPKDDDNGGGVGDSLSGMDNLDKDANKMGHWVKKYKSAIDNLYDLGKYIGDALIKAMKSIPWNDIYKSVGDWFRGLADFLNGFISPELFSETARMIAYALNTALHGLWEFANKFDWENFGNSIASGINTFFEKFNFRHLAFTINKFVNGIKTTIKTALQKTDWSKVWDGIKDFITALDDQTILLIVGAWLTPKVLSVFKTALLSKITGAFGGSLLNSAGALLLTIEVSLVVKNLINDVDKYKDKMGEDSLWSAIINGDKAKKQAYAQSKSSNPYAENSKRTQDWNSRIAKRKENKANPYDDNSNYSKNFDKMMSKVKEWQESNRSAREKEKAEFSSWYDDVSSKLSLTFENAKTSVKTWQDANNQKRLEEKAMFYAWCDETGTKIKTTFDEAGRKIQEWWTTKVAPWFTIEKWQTLWTNVKMAFVNKWNEIVKWWNSSAIVKWYNENVKTWFTTEKWNFSGIKQGLSRAFENAISSMKQIWNRFATWLNEKLNFSWDSVTIMGKQIVPAGNINLGKLPTFATGGFPEDGLFMANHNELVGQFSNGRTAVANNQQITEGIRQAVMDGMMQVIMATSGNNDKGGDINLYLDGRVIAQTTYNNLKTMGRQGVIPRFI